MPRTELEQRFRGVIVEEQLLEPAEPVLLGVSGGSDSVAMLSLFCGLRESPDWGNPLHVAHLNHQLRGPEAEADAAFVAQLCQRWNVPCTLETCDIAAQAQQRGVSVEQAGRDCRFDFFERVCLKQNLHVVALAHHADDNAETILHRILRGTGLRGLAGIPPLRTLRPNGEIRLIRPLLPFRKAEIEAYLQARQQTYRADDSNLSDQYTRNRIRNDLLPLLRAEVNPRVDEALLRLADQARAIDGYLTATCERILESLIVEENARRLVLHCPLLMRKRPPIQMQLIRQALLRLGVSEGELTYAHLRAVVDLAAGHEGSKSMHLPAGIRISRHYTRLDIDLTGEARPVAPAESEVCVALEGETPVPMAGLRLVVDRMQADPAALEEFRRRPGRQPGEPIYEEWIDADRVCPPLTARLRRPGDRFQPLGMTGLKKISDFLIDEKIDAPQRDRLVVLCDQLGPIWVVPLRIDERVRLTPATQRILRLRAM